MNDHVQTVLDLLKNGTPSFDFDSLDVATAYTNELADLDGKFSKECHFLTLALHAKLPGSHVYVVRDYCDEPVFSGVLWASNDLALNGQGFCTPGEMVHSAYWRGHEECKGAIEPAGLLASEVLANEANMSEALAKFGVILGYVYG